jgi:transposase
MREGILLMNRRDRDRLKVVHEVLEGHLTQESGGSHLGISERQVRRLVKRVREEGDAGVLHRSRGRCSNRRIPEATLEKVRQELKREEWRDFGPTYAQEQLSKLGYELGRETVRKLQLELGLRKARRRREIHRERRPRRDCFGEMVQMDTSIHDWLEGRGEEELVLVGMIDDASSRMRARFYRGDTSLANLDLLYRWTEEFGRPLILYVDKASHFKVNRPRWRLEEELEDHAPQTQIERAMGELRTEVIWANSPEAKGRVERLFETLQDRLVKGMRLKGIHTLEKANGYLEEEFLQEWERRWTVKAKSAVDAHRPVHREMDLLSIFSVREERTVKRDYTIQWKNRTFQITKQVHPGGLRGSKVEVETRVNGTLALRFKGGYLEFVEIEARSSRRRRPAPEIEGAAKVQPLQEEEWSL